MSGGPQPIKIAILAMGGEGGGVLADWIVDLGEQHGHIAQTTSVPGVAQRTGATIYCVELFPAAAAAQAGLAPVLALMPLPGDVDVVLASELMEAGRAVQRGLVTPDRSTFIASTHRVYAIAEKMAMGDGRVDSASLLVRCRAASQRFIGFDMAALAEREGSVISAVLFGALAGAGVLPFTRAQFESTIERGGVGVQASLRAFAAAFERAQASASEAQGDGAAFEAAPSKAPAAHAPQAALQAGAAAQTVPYAPPRASHPQVQALIDRAAAAWQGETLRLVIEGLRRLVDYQDPDYAALYLQRLAQVAGPAAADGRPAASEALAQDLARHLALWMSYEDTVRVADLKTRDTRFARVAGEVKAEAAQLVHIHEYLHPRLQEIADTLPAALGRWLLASGMPRRLVERFAREGRVVQTNSLRGFLLLTGVASMRRWRRASLRYTLENARIEAWLADIGAAHARDPALALEIVRCQRLVKGYGDTHERGWRHFEALRGAWQRGGFALPPTVLAELRVAALADEHGQALKAALQRHALA